MNLDKDLVLINGTDKTDQVSFCNFNNGNWHIRFKRSNKVYKYNENKVVWYRDPKRLETASKIIYNNNQPINGINDILVFEAHVRLIFNSGFKKTYSRESLTIDEDSLSNQNAIICFDYLKKLSQQIDSEEEQGRKLLSKQYDSLTPVSSQSVLSAYLERKPLKSESKKESVIFPFGFNASQKSATINAMNEQLSIIEGPPGTGKTQTILNIIANAIMNDKTVAVVSNNNSATSNVLEKLQKYGIDFLAAYLGNKNNKEKFFSEQSGAYPNMDHWVLEDTQVQSIRRKLEESEQELNQMLEFKNKQASLKQSLSSIKTEYKYFKDYISNTELELLQIKSYYKLSSDKVLQLLIEYERSIQDGKITWRQKLFYLMKYGIYNFELYKYSSEKLISNLQRLYYELKVKELETEISRLGKKLKNYDFDSVMKQYSADSMKLLKAKLAATFGKKKKRVLFDEKALWNNFGDFSKEYPIILSTTHSLRNNAPQNYLFDFVLVDEASQVDLVTGALALSSAKKAVIVGDMKQLPNVITSEIKKITTRIFEDFNVDEGYHYAKHSLLSSVGAVFKDAPRTLLKEHYRCHPKIIGFCNQKFYNNELVVLTEEEEEDQPLVIYQTAKGNHARDKINERQIDVILKEVLPQQKIELSSTGVISPYRLQADTIQDTHGHSELEVDTVHKFQGREKETIILTTVSNKVKANDFVDDAKLINVAISRAEEKLIVVVADGGDRWHGTNIGDLIRYIRYNNFQVIESKIHSVFDLLYSSYSDKLLNIMKKSKKVSKYTSENLMNVVIEEVLSDEKFMSLDFVLHQPLRMLIQDSEGLTKSERKYAMNPLTHTDFVIFNKMDKMPLLVVEVDGHAFHSENSEQLKRDQMKDQILQKYGIPVIRMKTTGSEEKEKLHNKLVEILR
ncbi:Superfamily I DNA and/or RNA helicase [Halobacillus alkaliphilus]|uniref:Superfamily I DNA and/or RNA helicase n=1 Tax=Halobacillus alkaliphilus TaxID=396056 RepID=A0A1I2KCB6_9BACI|nr:AAA domain-containing protein [Halobacillus alkaliphilus]SFF64695.1 Superfamily I DNA and/or RNA helicase [Halobacillus alkaliphilus]